MEIFDRDGNRSTAYGNIHQAAGGHQGPHKMAQVGLLTVLPLQSTPHDRKDQDHDQGEESQDQFQQGEAVRSGRFPGKGEDRPTSPLPSW
jgi:hypothetical protein